MSQNISHEFVKSLQAAKWTVTTAESCTGGAIASKITDIPGASAVFKLGFVTYANEIKTEFLGVSTANISSYGVVSREVAAEMAKGALRVAKADLAISVTGFAGSSQNKSADKQWVTKPIIKNNVPPIGSAFIGLATSKATYVLHLFIENNARLAFKQAVSDLCLEAANLLLNKKLLTLQKQHSVKNIWLVATDEFVFVSL